MRYGFCVLSNMRISVIVTGGIDIVVSSVVFSSRGEVHLPAEVNEQQL